LRGSSNAGAEFCGAVICALGLGGWLSALANIVPIYDVDTADWSRCEKEWRQVVDGTDLLIFFESISMINGIGFMAWLCCCTNDAELINIDPRAPDLRSTDDIYDLRVIEDTRRWRGSPIQHVLSRLSLVEFQTTNESRMGEAWPHSIVIAKSSAGVPA
jgi:hypothetical protein